MARTLVEVVTDDLTGVEIDSQVAPLRLAVDGVEYVLDLGPESRSAFDEAVKPFLSAGKVVSKPATAKKGRGSKRSDLAAVRVWAKENGFTVSDRGRIPEAVLAAFRAAH